MAMANGIALGPKPHQLSAVGALAGAHTTYYVAVDDPQPGGGVLLSARLSRPMGSIGTCRRVFKRFKRAVPTAHMVQVTFFR